MTRSERRQSLLTEHYSGAGLYLHIPFCSSICPYCDFAVLKGDRERREQFVETLVAEIRLYEGYEVRFDTIYFGGGTPSLLCGEELERVMDALRRHLDISDRAWVSLEANPEDVSVDSLASWRRLGVRTLTLGVQSFGDAELSFLGREHDSETARRAVEKALAAGFHTVSLDLIYGLPDQSTLMWRCQLDTAIRLAPDHLSCYQLTVHEKTVFGVKRRRGQLVELADDSQTELFFETHHRLRNAGYEGYEVSNFARRPEHRSPHNYKYWHHTPYLGLGPSAHSFDGRVRWWNEWKEGPWSRAVRGGKRPVAGREDLSLRELLLERLMLGLRTTEGVDLEEIRARHGVDLWRTNGEVIEEQVRAGRLALEGRRLVPTLAGMAVADSLALAFEVPGQAPSR